MSADQTISKTDHQFASHLDCVHCGAEINLPLRTVEDREDYWLSEDDSFTCTECSGVNHVTVDDFSVGNEEAYFQDCDDENCAACARSAA
jgi:hypothetical protein